MPIAYNIKNIAKEVMEELEKKQYYQEEIVPYNVQGIKFKYFIVEIK